MNYFIAVDNREQLRDLIEGLSTIYSTTEALEKDVSKDLRIKMENWLQTTEK